MNDFEPPIAYSLASGDIPATHEPAPRYEDDLWSHWEKVDKANTAVTSSQALLAELEYELNTKTEEVKKLKEKSSELFQTIHRKPGRSLPSPLKHLRRNSISSVEKELARREFEIAHRDETVWMLRVQDLAAEIESLKANIQSNMELASTVDQTFELLGASAIAILPPEEYATAEESLATASEFHDQMQQSVMDLTRARVTIQHAHHYYTTVLKTLDSVRDTHVGRLLIGGLGEVSKQQDYRLAMETANKAQVCFNEAVRVLTPHTSKMPPEILDAFKKIKERGLLQASKIYGFMYGWKTKTSHVRESVQVLLQRQEEVFEKLTRLTVWIQDTVPVWEAQLRISRESRDQKRRDLVAHWNRRRQTALGFPAGT